MPPLANTKIYESQSNYNNRIPTDDWGLDDESISLHRGMNTLNKPNLRSTRRQCVTMIQYIQDIILDSRLLEPQPLFTTWNPTINLWNLDVVLFIIVLFAPKLRKLILPIAVYFLCGSGRNTFKNAKLLNQFKTFIKNSKSFDNYCVQMLKFFQEMDLISGAAPLSASSGSGSGYGSGYGSGSRDTNNGGYRPELRAKFFEQMQTLGVQFIVFANNCTPLIDNDLLMLNLESYQVDPNFMPIFEPGNLDINSLKSAYRHFLTARRFLLCSILSISVNNYVDVLLVHLKSCLDTMSKVQFTVTMPENLSKLQRTDILGKTRKLEETLEAMNIHLQMLNRETLSASERQNIEKSFTEELNILDSNWHDYLRGCGDNNGYIRRNRSLNRSLNRNGSTNSHYSGGYRRRYHTHSQNPKPELEHDQEDSVRHSLDDPNFSFESKLGSELDFEREERKLREAEYILSDESMSNRFDSSRSLSSELNREGSTRKLPSPPPPRGSQIPKSLDLNLDSEVETVDHHLGSLNNEFSQELEQILNSRNY